MRLQELEWYPGGEPEGLDTSTLQQFGCVSFKDPRREEPSGPWNQVSGQDHHSTYMGPVRIRPTERAESDCIEDSTWPEVEETEDTADAAGPARRPRM